MLVFNLLEIASEQVPRNDESLRGSLIQSIILSGVTKSDESRLFSLNQFRNRGFYRTGGSEVTESCRVHNMPAGAGRCQERKGGSVWNGDLTGLPGRVTKSPQVSANPLKRIMRGIRRRTRVVGAIPDGKYAGSTRRQDAVLGRQCRRPPGARSGHARIRNDGPSRSRPLHHFQIVFDSTRVPVIQAVPRSVEKL